MKRTALLAGFCLACCVVPSAAAVRSDPAAASVFALVVPNTATIVLQTCADIGSRNEVVEYRSGGDVVVTQKIPGTLAFLNITCSRAVSDDKSLAQWRHLVEGAAPGTNFRKTGALVLYDHAMREVARWNLTNAWPASLTVAIDEATGDARETVVLAVEGVARQ